MGLILEKNDLTGGVPTQLGLLTKLEYLWITETDLSGSVPSQLGLLTSLKSLQLHDNDRAAAFPRSSGISTQPSGATLAARTATIAHYRHWGPNKWCRKLKRLKQAKKHVKKREGNEEKWEKK